MNIAKTISCQQYRAVGKGEALSSLTSSEIIEKHLKWLFKPGDVFEICLIGSRISKHPLWEKEWSPAGTKSIIAGWFNDINKAVNAITRADKDCGCTGIYTTLNPVVSALLGRADNRLKAKVARTQDKEIAAVRHLLIDADPIRPSGISSTDEEKQFALDVLTVIRADLALAGWPPPLFGDSGNGGHLIYKIESDTAEFVPSLLKSLSLKYSTAQVDIDTKVGNPSRLTKVYGTKTRKGDDTADRPHRYARIIDLPSPVAAEVTA